MKQDKKRGGKPSTKAAAGKDVSGPEQAAVQKAPAAPLILKRTSDKISKKASRREKSDNSMQEPSAEPTARAHIPGEARLAAGKALRDKAAHDSHAKWKRDKSKVDPLAVLQASDTGRAEQLIPIRYGRMLQSPFTFYRGSAAVMAADLAQTPASGMRVQACGDCHLLNFGGFATPERNILFDINDFDETLPAPWEWDVKRLVASFVLAARSNGFPDETGRDAAITCARAYRKRLREYSQMSPLEIWYARITDQDMIGLTDDERIKQRIKDRVAKATAQDSSDLAYPQLAGMVGGQIRIHDAPPLIFHPKEVSEDEFRSILEEGLLDYRKTLSDDRRELFDRYQLVDGAVKVVGIGSVGTACLVLLMMSSGNEPLFLQFKEARASVLEPYAGKSAYDHHGQRVVMGQRLTQPASDVFLGWVTGKHGRQGYMRQLRDAKIKPMVEVMDETMLTQYGKACGWVLARAHAKSGDPLMISGYLGKKDDFDEAMGDFALAYADQAERDHAALKAAVRAGKIAIQLEE
ncbi:MAG TPA: DUF2252 domain-containing protein [Terriglobales bacterium]|nr:DUF2252 domain-containing protein [Terriglobales bacterium]